MCLVIWFSIYLVLWIRSTESRFVFGWNKKVNNIFSFSFDYVQRMSGPNHPRSPLDLKPDPEMLMSNFSHGGGSYGQSGPGSRAQPPSPDGMTSSSMVKKTLRSKYP